MTQHHEGMLVPCVCGVLNEVACLTLAARLHVGILMTMFNSRAECHVDVSSGVNFWVSKEEGESSNEGIYDVSKPPLPF